MTEDQQSTSAEGEMPPPEASPLAGGGTPAKPRSGFARQKLKIKALERELAEERACCDRLFGDLERVERDYSKLEAAFNEIVDLNASLVQQIKQQQRPAPVRYGNLMGM